MFDFISDILNGRRLFKDCHRIFASVTIGLVFAPMAVFVPVLALVYGVQDHFSGWRKFLLPFIYPVAVIVATPSYVAYICYIAIRRIVDTAYQPEGQLPGFLRKIVDIDYQPDDSFNGVNLPGFLKFSEITLESETQLILGEFRNPIE